MGQNVELGEFLQSRRARLRPADAGLSPGSGPRRVPGLRREEVALLAGVSTDYYARLEQGRNRHVSDSVLNAVARALRLDPVEQGHLRKLARPPVSGGGRPSSVARVRPEVHHMLDVLNDVSPALVVNHRRDVLASNHLARALLADFDALPSRERNIARFTLLDPAARTLYRDWEAVAEGFVATLRLSSGQHPDDRLLNELIGEFCVKVPEFNRWWAAHQVRQCTHADERFLHPVVGEMTLHHEALTLPVDAGQTFCIYTAQTGTASQQALRLLASWTAPDHAPASPHTAVDERERDRRT
ncbi:helix-turn-helix transcriptional regulator [Streptomyces sp. NPDC050428]|uniref:helix-turn-helix domain-containing protein n=1 Tax=Streptomyces sp. NPDC050428 TaxID=3155757 RepID=UPI00342E29B1